MSKVAVIIPTRLKSERLPNKPLLDINGKTMIQRVYENVAKIYDSKDIYIASGDEKIATEAKKFGAKCLITDPSLPSGTDRIAAALNEIDPDGTKYDIIINFQGDGINVNPEINNDLIDLMIKTNADITTVCKRITNPEEIKNPNFVKIAMGLENGQKAGKCLYFSRSAIPFNRAINSVNEAFWHIGIYVYNAKSLKKFVELPVGILEAKEKLEQLRALENGMSIFAMEVDDVKLIQDAPADINTREEYEEALKFIK